MTTRRIVFAVLIAIAISGTFTLLLGRHFAKSQPHASAFLQYLVTSRQMNAGEKLTAVDVHLANWPGNLPLSGAFTSPDEIIGKTLLYPLANGQPILQSQFEGIGSSIGLATHIPDGMRALSLKSDQVVGVAGYLLPGTHVDVLATWHGLNSSEPVTSTVLQDVQILTAGEKMQPDPSGKPEPVAVVTILVTPQDAEKVVLASTQGTLHFALRNSSDATVIAETPTTMPVFGDSARAASSPRVRRASLPVPPKGYAVQVVQGDKQTMETFQ